MFMSPAKISAASAADSTISSDWAMRDRTRRVPRSARVPKIGRKIMIAASSAKAMAPSQP